MIDDPDAGVPQWAYWVDRDAWAWDLGDDTVLIVQQAETGWWMWAHTELVEGRPQGPLRGAMGDFVNAAEAIKAAETYERTVF